MNNPAVKSIAGGYVFTWDEGAQIAAHRIKEHGDRVTADIVVKTSLPGYSPYLTHGNLNLSSMSTRTQLRKQLSEKCAEIDWDAVLGQMTLYIIEQIHQIEEAVIVSSEGEYIQPEFLIHPILPLGEETILFGPRGSGKSYLAILMAVCSQLGWRDNPFGLGIQSTPAAALYLDWESTEQNMGWRLKCLQKGLSIPPVQFSYRECRRPLEDMLEQIQVDIEEQAIELIVIDSLGKAASGDLLATDTALRFWRAMRGLKTTSLIIAHTAKADDKRKTVYGNVFFENDPRYIWEIRQHQEVGDDQIDLGLIHYKSNITAKFPPQGFRLTFNEHATYVEKIDVTDIRELVVGLSIKEQIIDYLKDIGSATVSELGDATDSPVDSVRKTLNRGRDKWCVKLPGSDSWGLLAKEG